VTIPAADDVDLLPRHYLAGRPDRPDLVAKALASDADAVFLDFEDACPPSHRTAGRRALIDLLAERESTKPILVRCNPAVDPDGPLDLAATLEAGVRSIIFPKMESVGDLRESEDLLGRAEKEAGLEVGTCDFWLMIETPAGVVALDPMLEAAEREVEGVFVGPGDMSRSLELPVIRDGYVSVDHEIVWWTRAQCAVVARAHGVRQLLTAAYERNHDYDEVRAAAYRSFQMGYTGIEIQSPRHVPIVTEAWRPTKGELAHARRIVEAFDESLARDGEGVVIVGDQGIQFPTYAQARRTLARADRP